MKNNGDSKEPEYNYKKIVKAFQKWLDEYTDDLEDNENIRINAAEKIAEMHRVGLVLANIKTKNLILK